MVHSVSGHVSRRQFLTFLGAGVGAVGMVGLAGCGDGAKGGKSGKSGPYKGDMAITHLNAVINSAPFHIAAKKGYFTEEELTLSAVNFDGGSDTVRGIAQAGMKFGMPATIAVLIAQQKAAKDLRIIGGLYNAASVQFIAPANSPVSSVKDLRGRKIGVSRPGSITTYFGDRVPREMGLKPGVDVEIVNVGGPSETWTAAQQGVIDVAWGTAPLTTSMIASGKAKLVFDAADYVPAWLDTPLVTTQKFIDENGDVLKRWMQALHRSMEMIRTDPATAGGLLADVFKVDAAHVAEALKQSNKAWSLAINLPGVEENAKAALEMKQLSSEPDLDKIIVKDFVPAGES